MMRGATLWQVVAGSFTTCHKKPTSYTVQWQVWQLWQVFLIPHDARERGIGDQPNNFKSAATPATVATAPSISAFLRGRLLAQVATNLPRLPEVTSCPN